MVGSHNNSVAVTVSPLDAARDCLRRRWAVIPIPHGKKAPREKDWPNLRLSEADLPARFSNGENIGILLGEPSGGLVDIDLDAPEAAHLASKFLPATDLVHGRASKARSHFWYRAVPAPRTERFADIHGSVLAEIRSDGCQTVVPPSRHPSHECMAWERQGEPATVEAAELRRSVATLASAALLARHWPAPGSRHYAALALAGMLLRAGWAEEQVELFVGAVCEVARDEEYKGRIRSVISTAERLAQGRAATGTPMLAQILGREVVVRLCDWLFLERQRAPASDDWPEPAPLGDELLPVPTFSLELLPASLRPLVEDVSERMQIPLDYAAAAAIVALAGCVGRRAAIRPKLADTTWVVVPNLWGAIVAPPGMMKSPLLRAITLPLTHIEEKWRAEYESASADFEIEKEQAELRYQAWREQYKQAVKKGDTAPVQPDRTLREPTQRRLILTDSTFEKLHAILAENPAGVLVIRDELTGWLSELGRLGREGERGFFLQAWNGDSGFTIDRIGRGSIHVAAVCVSLLGNIQPARLRSYLSDAIEGGPTDDGLFQRFQILVWPDLPSEWRLVDRPANQVALQTAESIFSILAELSADEPVRMCFVPDAQELFFVWWGELERKVRGNSGLAPALVAHLSKYRSLMPSLAGLFELADRATANEAPSGELSISLDHSRQAAAFCDYLEGHARRVYACVISPETRSARELARHIQADDFPSPFSTRTTYLKGWGGLDTPERVRAALTLLEEAGWVVRVESTSPSTGGRPSELWLVNPKAVRRA